MIPKAEALAGAEREGLLPTTIEKDYALGWVLCGIAQHPTLSRWMFKGGTCLKKCYFETDRFSEDLDFTLPDESSVHDIREGLMAVGAWVRDAAGILVPEDGIEVEESVNKLRQVTYQAKLTFQGPLALAQQQRQRVKFERSSIPTRICQPRFRRSTPILWMRSWPRRRVPWSSGPDGLAMSMTW